MNLKSSASATGALAVAESFKFPPLPRCQSRHHWPIPAGLGPEQYCNTQPEAATEAGTASGSTQAGTGSHGNARNTSLVVSVVPLPVAVRRSE